MTESDAHRTIKEQGIKILKGLGFKDSDIIEEYHCHEVGLRPDLVGINDRHKVAVECGNMSFPGKEAKLRAYFDRVIHLPYLNNKIMKIKEALKDIVPEPKAEASLIDIALYNIKLLAIADEENDHERLLEIIDFYNSGCSYESFKYWRNKDKFDDIIQSIMSEDGTFWTGDIGKAAGLNDSEVDEIINKLNMRGDIYRTGPRKGASYKFIDDIRD